ETWMLWVGHRVAHGDTLYRDVYFVTTPLAAWVAALASLVTGSQLVVLRLLVSACFTAQILVALSAVKCCGMGRAGRVAVGPVLLAILATGAWSSFVGDVFLNKGEYVSEGFSYFDTLDHHVRLALGSIGDDDAFHRLRVVPMLAPFVVLVVVTLAVARADR